MNANCANGEAFVIIRTFDAPRDTVWKAWTDRVKEETGRKGKSLFMPLRLALTGLSSGPELAELLPLLGREGTLARQP